MRDYQKQPLKRGELIPKQELYDYYIKDNHSLLECYKHFNITRAILRRQLKLYKITKPKELTEEILEKTMMQKFGVKNIFEKTDYIKQKTKEKLGVENCSLLDTCIQKRKQTCQERYGGTAPANSPEVKEKMKQTNLQRYGSVAPIGNEKIKEKVKETNLEKYGTEYAISSEQVKQKSKQTLIEKYGTDKIMSLSEFKDKAKKTCLKRYGKDNYTKTEEYIDKVKQTNNKKYGHDFYMQTEDFREKTKETCLEKYGVDHACKNDVIKNQIFKTMKNNGSYRKSKPEEEIYDKLLQKFSKVKRQYKDNRYPFNCDFYIEDLDVFIEYQGYQGHGTHAYDPDNIKDREQLIFWENKAKEINLNGKNKTQYNDYIKTWTISDPLKRKTAKENNLNWIEFFSLEEFNEWFEKQ